MRTHPRTFRLHRLNSVGGATWWNDVVAEPGEAAADVLTRVARARAEAGRPFEKGTVFFVAPVDANGNGNQALFRLDRLPEPPLAAIPVTLADLAARKASWTEG